MATINKIRVGGSNYDIEDPTARASAYGKADIANSVSSPWLNTVISDTDSSLTIVTASIRETNIAISTAYGTGMYWVDVTLTIPSSCQPANGFYSVTANANMLAGAGAVTCVVMQHSKSQIIIRLLNPVSGTFTFDLMVQAFGY